MDTDRPSSIYIYYISTAATNKQISYKLQSTYRCKTHHHASILSSKKKKKGNLGCFLLQIPSFQLNWTYHLKHYISELKTDIHPHTALFVLPSFVVFLVQFDL